MKKLQDFSLFKELNQEELVRVRDKVKERSYLKGETVFLEGQESDGLYLIAKGMIKVSRFHQDGREKTLAILIEGDILGEMTLFGSEYRSAAVETLDQTTFLVISREKFRALLQELPRLAIALIEILSNRVRLANRQIQEMTFLNARSRVICNLLRLVEEQGLVKENGLGVVVLRLTHAEFAKLAGVTRETATKVFKELQDLGLIKTAHRKLQITDINDLYQQLRG